MEYAESIKQNNDIINSLIEKIIRETNEDCFVINDAGEKDFSPVFKNVIELEINKILKIYHLEMPNIPEFDVPTLSVYDGNNPDGKYERDTNEVMYCYAIKKMFESLKKGIFFGEQLGYEIDTNGKVTFDKNGEKEKTKVNLIDKKDGLPYIITEDERVENELDSNDEFLYYYLNDMKPEHLILATLPHELMHSMGFSSGIFEGLTENLTREIAKKYNITNFPSARKDLVKLMQSIEKIIGRDNLTQSANVRINIEEDIERISNEIDAVIESEQRGLLKHYYDIMQESEKYGQELEISLLKKLKAGEITNEQAVKAFSSDEKIKEYKEILGQEFDNLNQYLNEFILQNPDKLHSLGSSNADISEESINDILSFQQSEIYELSRIIDEITKETQISEKSTVSYFQEQKSDDFFEDMKSGHVSVPLTKKLGKETIEEQSDIIIMDEVRNVEENERKRQQQKINENQSIGE